MENLETTGQPGNPQNNKELVNAVLLFANALGLIIKNGQGIVIDVKGDVDIPNMKKVIIYNQDDKIHITECHEDLEEGSVVEFDVEKSED
jgi:hypothetical protein